MEAIVTIVETTAVTIAAIRNPEYAIHGADRTANAGTDRAANHPADRTGGPVAFVSAFLRAAHDALRMSDMGHRQQREGEGSSCEVKPCGGTGRQRHCPELRFHLNSLKAGRDGAGGAGICNAGAAKRLRGRDEFTTSRQNRSGMAN